MGCCMSRSSGISFHTHHSSSSNNVASPVPPPEHPASPEPPPPYTARTARPHEQVQLQDNPNTSQPSRQPPDGDAEQRNIPSVSGTAPPGYPEALEDPRRASSSSTARCACCGSPVCLGRSSPDAEGVATHAGRGRKHGGFVPGGDGSSRRE